LAGATGASVRVKYLLAMLAVPIAVLVAYAALAAVLARWAGPGAAARTCVALLALPLPGRWRGWLVAHRIRAAPD
jgi:hypothetical protein